MSFISGLVYDLFAPYYKDVNHRRFCYLLSAAALGCILIVSGCNRGDHPAQVGKPAPDFTVSDGTSTVHLASYHGKVVVLNFWASWCGPCIQETPALKQLHHDMPNLAIIGVSVDEDPDAYRHFLKRFQVDIPTVRDPDQIAAKLYHTDGWPETYIIDRQGVVRRKVVGDPDWNNPEIRAYLSRL